MFAVADGEVVGKFVTVLIRESAPVQEIWFPEHDPRASGNRDLGGDSLLRDRLSRDRRLRVFEFEIPPILKAELVDHRRCDRGNKPCDYRVIFHKIVSKSLRSAKHHSGRLDPGGR